MKPANNYLFNFSVSYSGGGYKRLVEYAKWFDVNGGAWFVIHPRCTNLPAQFLHNTFRFAAQSRLQRLHNDCGYLEAIRQEMGQPDLYYAYGIPMYFRFGRINWFHLSNVLPLGAAQVPLSLFDRLKLAFLGRRIRGGLANADVISAESEYSLSLIDRPRQALFLSVNGSDDELACMQEGGGTPKESIATVVGTYSYKAIEDSFRVFEMLKREDSRLRLIIVGNPEGIPRQLRGRSDVVVRGLLKRPEVIDCLRRSKFYISTTRIENSYNAASEGIFIATESYISDIGPHRELLKGMPVEEVTVPNVQRPLLRVQRAALSSANLKTWDTVVSEMIARVREAQRGR